MNPVKRKKLARLRRLREASPLAAADEAPADEAPAVEAEPAAGLRYPKPTPEPKGKPAAKKTAAKKKSVVKKITEMLDKE